MQLHRYDWTDGSITKQEVTSATVGEAKTASLALVADATSSVYRATIIDPIAGGRILWDSDVLAGLVAA